MYTLIFIYLLQIERHEVDYGDKVRRAANAFQVQPVLSTVWL